MISQKGLIEVVKELCGDGVAEKIDKIAYSANLFVLHQVSIHMVTDTDIEAGFAEWKVRYPDRTLESYKKFREVCYADKFNVDIEPQGYFINGETAKKCAVDNIGDLYECGSFPYIVISELPLNSVYPTADTCRHILYKFNLEKNEYEQIEWNTSDEAVAIKKFFI